MVALAHRDGGSGTSPLGRLAFAQHGVVHRTQLRRLGYSDRQIDRLVAAGLLIRIHHGVYAVGHARLGAHGLWMAAVLAAGPGALLSHRDASALHDLERIGAGAVHVTAHRVHRIPGVRCHRTRAELAVTTVDGVPATTIERALLDRAAELPRQRVRSLLEQAERLNALDAHRLDAELARSNGHRGVGTLRAALAELTDDVSPALRSGLEQAVLELIRGAGLPEPAVNTILDGECVDLRWPGYGLTVEIDSWCYHRDRRRFSDDRRRGNALRLAGEPPLRYTDDQIAEDPATMLAEIAQALRAGGWPG